MDDNNVNPAVQTNDDAAPAAAPASPIDPAAFAAAMEAYLKAVGTAAPAAATADSAVDDQNPAVNTNDPPPHLTPSRRTLTGQMRRFSRRVNPPPVIWM